MAYPGGLNTYIPTAIKALQTDYSQNPSLFSVNKYSTVAPVPKPSGNYIYHDPTEETRINHDNLAEFKWADGAFPQVNMSKGQSFVPFVCERYQATFTIGDVAAENADGWNVITDHANTATMRLMTVRTFVMLNALVNASWGSNTATATVLGGGYWNCASNAEPGLNYIKRSITAAIQTIQKATNAVIRPSDLTLVISPTVAAAIGLSSEIIDYLKQSYVAQQFISQTPESAFYWGVPDPLYGIRVVIEDRVRNEGAHGAAMNADYILGNDALILARPGSVIGGLNTMSTATFAMYQDMNMTLEHVNLAQLTQGVLWDFYTPIIQPATGFLITEVTGECESEE